MASQIKTPSKPLSGAELCALVMHRHGLSIRALGRRCGVSAPTALAWVEGRAIPTDSHGLTLAALADLEACSVLIGLNLVRTDCPDGRAAWRALFVEHCRAVSATLG